MEVSHLPGIRRFVILPPLLIDIALMGGAFCGCLPSLDARIPSLMRVMRRTGCTAELICCGRLRLVSCSAGLAIFLYPRQLTSCQANGLSRTA